MPPSHSRHQGPAHPPGHHQAQRFRNSSGQSELEPEEAGRGVMCANYYGEAERVA